MDTSENLRGEQGQVCKGTQILLALRYQELIRSGLPMPSFSDVEFRNYSQSGEDGILHYIFSVIGTTNRIVVEMCAGDGIECNSANLILNHGFTGLLVDGNERNIAKAKGFYKTHRDTCGWQPNIVSQWLTRENVGQFLQQQWMFGEIDLFSLDIDGNDYWIWEAIDQISPRVVVVEYDSGFGPDEAFTMKYDPEYDSNRQIFEPGIPLWGASLAAFVKLGRRKGYRLVGSQRFCFNAFFLRNDVGAGVFPEVSSGSCLIHPMVKLRWNILRERSDQTWRERFVEV
jgi:hypothetical protein